MMSNYIFGSSLSDAKSKANYLFEGEFRRRPNQNLSGASRSLTGVQLLQQAAEQRQNREDTRRKETSSLIIQALWRGYSVRKRLARLMRQNIDSMLRNLESKSSQRVTRRSTALGSSFSPEIYTKISGSFLVYYNSKEDDNRFYSLIDLMLQHKDVILNSKQIIQELWLYRLCKFMRIGISLIRKQLSSNICDNIKELDKIIDFMITFTQCKQDVDSPLGQEEASALWVDLIGYGLFEALRQLADYVLEQLEQPKECDRIRGSIIELIRRCLDVEPVKIHKTNMMPARFFFYQFLKGPIKPALENSYFIELLKLEPRQLQSSRLLEAFHESTESTVGFHNQPFGSSLDNHHSAEYHCRDSIWLCYMFLKALYTQVDKFSETEKVNYLITISNLIAPAEQLTNLSLIEANNNDGEELSDEDTPSDSLSYGKSSRIFHQMRQYNPEEHHVISRTIELINKLPHINSLKTIIFSGNDRIQSQVQSAIVHICNLMLAHEYLAIFNCRLLYTIAFSKEFSRLLWRSIVTMTCSTIYGTNVPVYQLISRGSNISQESWRLILPKLKLFCCLCSYLLPTLGDEEFYTTNGSHSILGSEISQNDDVQMFIEGNNSGAQQSNPSRISSNVVKIQQQSGSTTASSSGIGGFYVDKELIGISTISRDLCIGLIDIIYNDNKYHFGAISVSRSRPSSSYSAPSSSFQDDTYRLLAFEIKSCFQALVRFVCQLHARDSRKQFCPDGHWICPSVVIPANKAIDFQLVTSQQGRLLNNITKDEQSKDRLASVSCEIKTVLILQEIPFVIPFHDRVQIFHQLLRKERLIHQLEDYHFGLPGSAISARIRRNYIYEDAFDMLSYENQPNMKLPLKISLINEVGVEEAGIDGGGLTKEFISELLKNGFDPMRGFFKYTKDHFLYPNPSANVLFSNTTEGYEIHFEFLGRMLGKAIFEKIMVELPLAGFFLAKLLAAKHSSDIDLHNLESLDPVLYKNLVYLKNYKGDVADLNLDFTISNNELDEHEIVELKPGGSKIPVTRENKIEYVHLVADYRLNKQIRIQCAAFKRGLAQLIDLNWLRMFDPRELQILISGAPTEIDVSDWRRHTIYGNGYTDKSDAVETFWRVVHHLDEIQKRKLLKFATSCSLPPLLGFKDLVPQFAIVPSEETRLPTASTCMNLLKLPQCCDDDTMRSKLLYAIESNAGFELS